MGACLCCCSKKAEDEAERRGSTWFLDRRNTKDPAQYLQEIMAYNKTHLVQHVIDKEDFEMKLKEAGSKLVVVDFFATWCGPCKIISPEVEKLAETMTDVIFLKVDVDQIEELTSEYGIASMPTFVAIVDGKRVGDMSGANLEKLRAFINEYKPKL